MPPGIGYGQDRGMGGPGSISQLLSTINNYRNMRPMIPSGIRGPGRGPGLAGRLGAINNQPTPEDKSKGIIPPGMQAAIPPGVTNSPPSPPMQAAIPPGITAPPNPNQIPPFQAAIPPGLMAPPPQMNFEQLAPLLAMLRQFNMRGPFGGRG